MTALSPDRRLVSLSLKVVVRQASWILIFFFFSVLSQSVHCQEKDYFCV